MELTDKWRARYGKDMEAINFKVGQASDDDTYSSLSDNGSHIIDFNISMVPSNEREKGLEQICDEMRADLAQAIADIRPRFVRFPGGCVAHGNGLDNIYRWENTIGPLESRKPLRNLWGYHQTMGLGYYEYFLF